MKKNFILVLIALLTIALLLSSCTEENPTVSMEETQITLTEEESEEAADDFAETSQNIVSSAIDVYCYAFPYMAEEFGDSILDMSGIAFFEKYSSLLADNKNVIEPPEDLVVKMTAIGYDSETFAFSTDNLTSSLYTELDNISDVIIKCFSDNEENESVYYEDAKEVYDKLVS